MVEDTENPIPTEDEPASSLPHSLEAEQAVLGGLIQDASQFHAVCEIASEGDYYKAAHRKIFRVMTRLSDREQPLDVITVAEALDHVEELEQVGGVAYLTDLATNVPSSANVVAYARIVREKATLRQLISAATEISRASYNPSGLGSDDLLELNRLLVQLRKRPYRHEHRPFRVKRKNLRLAAWGIDHIGGASLHG